MRAALAGCLALSLLGCAPSLEEVCTELAEDCESFEGLNCLNGGHEVQSRAIEAGCEDAFNEYLDCVSDSGCGWSFCDATQRELEACVGPFPDSE
jgi:hypothetical protein